MAVVFTLDLPGVTAAQLARTNEILLAERGGPPAGLILHLESPSDGGMRVIDIWETPEEFETFAQTTLMSALETAGITPSAPPEFRPVTTMFGSSVDETDYSALAATFYGAFSRNDPNVRELFTEDFVDHEDFPGVTPDRDGVAQWLAIMHSAFSGLTMTAQDTVGRHGTAAARVRMTGKHTGAFLGVPATGRDVDVEAVDLVKLDAEGRCREHWGVLDVMGLLNQLGAIPAQAPATEVDARQQV
jgi:steroid delta-isomerase-like uncharacterized protein